MHVYIKMNVFKNKNKQEQQQQLGNRRDFESDIGGVLLYSLVTHVCKILRSTRHSHYSNKNARTFNQYWTFYVPCNNYKIQTNLINN